MKVNVHSLKVTIQSMSSAIHSLISNYCCHFCILLHSSRTDVPDVPCSQSHNSQRQKEKVPSDWCTCPSYTRYDQSYSWNTNLVSISGHLPISLGPSPLQEIIAFPILCGLVPRRPHEGVQQRLPNLMRQSIASYSKRYNQLARW